MDLSPIIQNTIERNKGSPSKKQHLQIKAKITISVSKTFNFINLNSFDWVLYQFLFFSITFSHRFVSFGYDNSWQAPLIFSLTAHIITSVSVLHRKLYSWRHRAHDASQVQTNSNTWSQRERLMNVHYQYWSTSPNHRVNASYYLDPFIEIFFTRYISQSNTFFITWNGNIDPLFHNFTGKWLYCNRKYSYETHQCSAWFSFLSG